jgi:N,N'-diacetyllegionaminate synthase
MGNVIIIAEIGWNHMGDMELASKMIQSAAKNGADVCKFQTWSEDKLKEGAWDHDGRRSIYKRAQLSPEDHQYLKKVCEQNQVKFLTSVFNENDLHFLDGLGMGMIKIPSHEVYNIELIKKAEKFFDKILVSTGASKWDEVMRLVETIDPEKLVLMHCVSAYPCPVERINLPRLQRLRELSGIVGYSGHYSGIDDAIAAICRGTTYIEKHYTIEHDLPGRDNKFAILPEQLKSLANFRDNYQLMNTDLGLDLQDIEQDTYDNYRGRWSKDGK